ANRLLLCLPSSNFEHLHVAANRSKRDGYNSAHACPHNVCPEPQRALRATLLKLERRVREKASLRRLSKTGVRREARRARFRLQHAERRRGWKLLARQRTRRPLRRFHHQRPPPLSPALRDLWRLHLVPGTHQPG